MGLGLGLGLGHTVHHGTLVQVAHALVPRKSEQRGARVHHRTLGEETGAPHRVSRACKGLQQGVGEGTPPCWQTLRAPPLRARRGDSSSPARLRRSPRPQPQPSTRQTLDRQPEERACERSAQGPQRWAVLSWPAPSQRRFPGWRRRQQANQRQGVPLPLPPCRLAAQAPPPAGGSHPNGAPMLRAWRRSH